MPEPAPLPDELAEVTRKLIAACKTAGVEFALIGGIAVGALGLRRPTDDVDACLDLRRSEGARVEALLAALEREGFRFRPEAVRCRFERGLNLFAVYYGEVRVDLLLRHPDARWDDALRYRRRVYREPLDLWIASPEDVVALKLAAGRPVDLADARNVVAVMLPELDLARLRASVARFADRLGMPDLPATLERMIEEARAI